MLPTPGPAGCNHEHSVIPEKSRHPCAICAILDLKPHNLCHPDHLEQATRTGAACCELSSARCALFRACCTLFPAHLAPIQHPNLPRKLCHVRPPDPSRKPENATSDRHNKKSRRKCASCATYLPYTRRTTMEPAPSQLIEVRFPNSQPPGTTGNRQTMCNLSSHPRHPKTRTRERNQQPTTNNQSETRTHHPPRALS